MGGFQVANRAGPNRLNVISAAVDAVVRGKDYLDPGEVEDLLAGAKGSRHPERDKALVLMMCRHGLRVSEATAMRRQDVDLKAALVYVNRLKNGLSTRHPMDGTELRVLRRYLATRKDNLPWLFVSERGDQLTRQAVYFIVRGMAARACLPNVHPHTLRHSCGFALANKGQDSRLIQDYLGHKNARHTAHYTRTAAVRFEGLWS